jgi:hypothetical protein
MTAISTKAANSAPVGWQAILEFMLGLWYQPVYFGAEKSSVSAKTGVVLFQSPVSAKSGLF